MIASKLERRIACGKILGTDITGKPLGELQGEMKAHKDATVLEDVYDKVVVKLNDQASPEQRVNDALALVSSEVSAGTVEPATAEPVATS